MRTLMRLGIVILVLVQVGCGADPNPRAKIEKVVPASGTLTFDGKALPSYQVSFRPKDDRRPATGVTDKDGKFTLGTNAPGDGAPPGECKVAVVWVPPQDDGLGAPIDNPANLPKAPVKLPKKYESSETSGITMTVPEGGTSDLKIDLK